MQPMENRAMGRAPKSTCLDCEHLSSKTRGEKLGHNPAHTPVRGEEVGLARWYHSIRYTATFPFRLFTSAFTSSAQHAESVGMASVFNALSSQCPNLQEAEIYYGSRERSGYSKPRDECGFAELHNLTKVSIHIIWDVIRTQNFSLAIMDLLISECDGLQDLHMEGSPTDSLQLFGFLDDTYWGRLGNFTAKNVQFFTDDVTDIGRWNIFAGFVHRDAYMERIYFSHTDIVFLKQIENTGTLQNLHSIQVTSSLNKDLTPYRLFKMLPRAAVDNLWHFHGPIDEKTLPLLAQFHSLRSCIPIMKYTLLPQLTLALPFLERLSVHVEWNERYRGDNFNHLLLTHIDSLMTMGSLMHLAGFMASISLKFADGMRILRRLASLRRLRYIQAKTIAEGGWVTINWNAEGNFAAFR
ncbi:hypothetical protein M422DRAFT_51520 [Sphaerobolus stellatus SS14]|uniref:Uncharacterized protein n=1 Tax=Sphaerobolus stellatus (strain SS14) TaxID=990650 RepID=A0A0C9UKR7_SPHS4|nr:hypothetical protein M422DRAFT_51520 [Sphaerobolus stellatus SS14]